MFDVENLRVIVKCHICNKIVDIKKSVHLKPIFLTLIQYLTFPHTKVICKMAFIILSGLKLQYYKYTI